MCSEFDSDFDDASDVADAVESDVAESFDTVDDIESDVSETLETSDDVDRMLDGMSLDELYELRDSLSATDISEDADNSSDIQPLSEETDVEAFHDVDISEMAEIEPLENDIEESDYSYHWDGGPTHNVEWDEEAEPTTYVKKLTR